MQERTARSNSQSSLDALEPKGDAGRTGQQIKAGWLNSRLQRQKRAKTERKKLYRGEEEAANKDNNTAFNVFSSYFRTAARNFIRCPINYYA